MDPSDSDRANPARYEIARQAVNRDRIMGVDVADHRRLEVHIA